MVEKLKNLKFSGCFFSAALILASIGLVSGTAAADDNPPNPERNAVPLPQRGQLEAAGIDVDPRKSLFVTEQVAMREIRFVDVIDALAAQAGVSRISLVKNWWNTQRVGNEAEKQSATFCNSEAPTQAGFAKLNGFPYECPRTEHHEAAKTSFGNGDKDTDYTAIAAVNRFDLSSKGKRCGEYRLIFARKSGVKEPTNRNFIIFEAAVNPSAGSDDIKDCAPIQKFWASLSEPAVTPSERGIRIRNFFLSGLPASSIPSIIRMDSFGLNQAKLGQIRTNQFMRTIPGDNTSQSWLLREFQFVKKPAAKFALVPKSVKANAAPELFKADKSNPKAVKLAASIVQAMRAGTLLNGKISDFSFSNEDELNSGDSNSQNASQGSQAQNFSPSGAIGRAIEAELSKIPRPKPTAINIVERVQAMSCAGCHQYTKGNLGFGGPTQWPASLGFTHVNQELVAGPVPRFKTSPFVDADLLLRESKMEEFLNNLQH